jgi:hypothetical protein
MRRLAVILSAALLALGTILPASVAAAPPPRTFVAVLNAAEEVPTCAPAGRNARGVATFHVTNATLGTVRWKLVANNLPGSIVAAHIHLAPKGVAGPVVQPTPPTPGAENGVIGSGSFTNPALVAAMQANPQAYYVNVHTTVCAPGAIRGQLGTHGPPGTAE